jgi:hypothetical protein
MSEQQYPALWQFLGAYRHQDWREEYESPSAALRDFVSGDSGYAVDLPTEIERVLISTTDDAALEETLVDLGSFFLPSRTGQDPREWLSSLRDETRVLVRAWGTKGRSPGDRMHACGMENLEHLIGAYFNQDWNHVYATRYEAVADFVRRSPDRAARVSLEIDELLSSTGSGEELAAHLSAMGFDDAPPEGDRAFLIDIRTYIRRHGPLNVERVPPTVLADLEETFEDEGMLPLYQVAWTMSGSVSRDDDRFEALCREAYDVFIERHPGLQLVWVPWPIDLAHARPAAPDTPIDLDLDPEAPADTLLLALVTPAHVPA